MNLSIKCVLNGTNARKKTHEHFRFNCLNGIDGSASWISGRVALNLESFMCVLCKKKIYFLIKRKRKNTSEENNLLFAVNCLKR